MSGWIRIDRDLWGHPLFPDEPMSEREAWAWMVARASWEDTKHRVGQIIVNVPRGSFMTTLRELQGTFMWRSDTKVRNFLKRLEAEGMIERTTEGTRNAPKTHVTICNYEKYQGGERTENAPKTHRERTKNAVKEQDNNKQQEEDTSVFLSACADPTPANDLSHAVSRFNAAAAAAGWSQVQKLTPQRSKQLRARLKECGGLGGWEGALKRAYRSDFLCGRTEKAWAGFGFDWLVKQANFTKLMEGNYDNRTSKNGRVPNRPENRVDPVLANIARLAGLGEAQGDALCGTGSDGLEDGPFRMGAGTGHGGS